MLCCLLWIPSAGILSVWCHIFSNRRCCSKFFEPWHWKGMPVFASAVVHPWLIVMIWPRKLFLLCGEPVKLCVKMQFHFTCHTCQMTWHPLGLVWQHRWTKWPPGATHFCKINLAIWDFFFVSWHHNLFWTGNSTLFHHLALPGACLMLVSCLAYTSTLKMEATCFSEMSDDFLMI
jgi:hypothetical protein